MSLLENLKARFAGDTLRGLRGEAAAAKARTLSRARKMELRSDALALVRAIRTELETARRQEQEGLRLHGLELADQGKSLAEFSWHPEKAPLQLKVCERYISEYRDEFGLRDQPHRSAAVSLGDVIQAINERAAMLGDVLRDDYRAHGVPAEVVELRHRITESIRAEWPLRKAQKEAREMNNGTGGKFEAEAIAANAALAEAEAVTAALRRELADRYGLGA